MSTSEHFSALTVGARIRDYVIESILGSGGFGITYRATEAITERAVAIKEYLPPALATRDRDGMTVQPVSAGTREDFEWGLARFRQEAKVLIGLKHPNIVPVLSYFEANGTGYLVMEFQAGRSLGQKLGRDGVLTEAQLLPLVGPILSGLEAVHRAGFLHRDIKPDNIFIRDDATPVLIDFGAARQALGRQSRSLTAVLTEGYAPYEQYERDGNQGPWTDIYALGAVMMRCLTGARPVEAPKRIAARMRNAPDPLAASFAKLRGVASPHVADAVEAAMAATEAERPQSVDELRRMLAGNFGPDTTRHATEHTLIPGALASPAGHAQSAAHRPRRRTPAIAAAVAAFLAAASAIAYVALDGGDRKQTRAADAKRETDETERKRAEQDRARAEAEAERKAGEERRASEEAARRRAEAERGRAEDEARRKADAERRAKEEADRRRDEEKRAAEGRAARNAGPRTEAAAQLATFKTVYDRVLTSYIDELSHQRLATAAIQSLWNVIGSPVFERDPWRQDIERARSSDESLAIFEQEFKRAHAAHAARFGGSRLIHKVIDGLLLSLDLHSSFMDTEAYREFQTSSSGEFAGVGMEIAIENELPRVVAPVDNAPAARAGIRAGDWIVQIEGEPTIGLTLIQAVNKLRGRENTNVLLRVRRGERETFEVTLTRAKIAVPAVRGHIEGTVGIVRIANFTDRTQGELRETISGFKRQLGDTWSGLVLDLRNNSGGTLDRAGNVADEFLNEGEIVTVRGRGAGAVRRLTAKQGDAADGRPLVILVNKGTAGASEIVAAALQDHGRAILLGTTSYGKGTLQTIIPLAGQGAIRLTTGRCLSPKGRQFDKVGLTPDIVLDADTKSRDDVQLRRAIEWVMARKR